MYLLLSLNINMSQRGFIVIVSTIELLMYPGYLIKFPPDILLTQCDDVSCSLMSHTDHINVAFILNEIWGWYKKIGVGTCVLFKPCESCLNLLHIRFYQKSIYLSNF